MQISPDDEGKVDTPIWDTYRKIVEDHDERGKDAIGQIERFQYYEEARNTYAIIATSEPALYANIMLQKGVI